VGGADAAHTTYMSSDSEDARDEEALPPETETAEPPPKKKKAAPFMKKVQGIQSRLDAKQKALAKQEGFISNMMEKQRSQPLLKKEMESLARWRAQVDTLASEVKTMRSELEDARREASEKQAAAEAAAAAAADKRQLEAELSREYTDAALITLVNEKCKKDSKFDNNSDNHDLVWQHVGDAMNKKVDQGELSETDRRSYKAHRARSVARARCHAAVFVLFPLPSPLIDHHRHVPRLIMHRYGKEYNFFKIWASTAQRAMESGVSRDELLEKVAGSR